MGNIIIGIIFVIGGLSGELVLMGTNSPEALVGVGALLIAVGAFKLKQS